EGARLGYEDRIDRPRLPSVRSAKYRVARKGPASSSWETERFRRAFGAALHHPPAEDQTLWCRRYFLRFFALGRFRASRAVSSQGGRPTQEKNPFGRRPSGVGVALFLPGGRCPVF